MPTIARGLTSDTLGGFLIGVLLEQFHTGAADASPAWRYRSQPTSPNCHRALEANKLDNGRLWKIYGRRNALEYRLRHSGVPRTEPCRAERRLDRHSTIRRASRSAGCVR